MSRRSWADLPEDVRHEMEARCGGIVKVIDAPAGTACDFAGTLVTPSGPLFCKAVHQDARGAWMLHNEVRINRWLPEGTAPQLVWDLSTGAWRAAAFEHVEGHHANLSPGSPDLDPVAAAFNEVSRSDVTHWAVPLQPIQQRWRATDQVDLGDVSLYAGSTLLHTDPVASNLIVTPGGSVKIIDWGWPGRGAAWIDTALIVTCLIRIGHQPADAEHWASKVDAWANADPQVIDAFADTMAALRSHQAHTNPAPHRPKAAASARRWAEHRRAARTTRQRGAQR